MNFRLSRIRQRFSAMLSGQRDRWGGVTVHSSDYEGMDQTQFHQILKKSLQEWRETGVRIGRIFILSTIGLRT